MRRFPIVNLGQFEGLPLDGETLSRLCDAVNAWNNAESTEEGARTMRDAVADVRSILGPMNLTNRRAAEAQMYFGCNNARAILDQISFAQPPPAEMVTTPQLPFYTPEPPKPPTTYKPVASIDRYIQTDEPYNPPVGLTYEPTATTGSEPEPEPTPYTPPQPPMVPTGGAGCWYTPGQGYSWGARPSGSETTGLNQSDCENIMRYDREIRGQSVNIQPQVPVQPMQESEPMVQATQYSWNREPAECSPPMVLAPGGGCMPGPGYGGGGGGGGYGGLVNFGPSGGGMPISGGGLMGRRFPVVNL